MNDAFSRGMAAATRLTQMGKLGEATAYLQQLLGSNSVQQTTEPTVSKQSPQSSIVDTPEMVTSRNLHLRAGLNRIASAKKPRNELGRAVVVPADMPPAAGEFITKSFSNNAGQRAYKLYVPTRREGGPRPLIVMLHGCMQSPDDFAAGTRMNARAEERECFVAYPEQPSSANTSKCWNWFKSSEQIRGQGEPSIVADLTRDIIKCRSIDPNRVYIAGLSAGGAAAAIMGEAYPELFAAIGVHSGLACGVASDMPSAIAAMGGQHKSPRRPSVRQSTTFVPTIVFHGDRDSTVHPRNGSEVVARARELNELKPIHETIQSAGRSCTRSLHRDASGQTLIEEWIIHGSGHAWSGGSKAGSFADPAGPDASREMLRFFLAHSKHAVRG